MALLPARITPGIGAFRQAYTKRGEDQPITVILRSPRIAERFMQGARDVARASKDGGR